MRAANTDQPFGRPYVEAFGRWKKEFGYIHTGDMSTAFFDDCLVVAEHRELAEQIIGETTEDERFAFGLSSIAKRTRARVKAIKAELDAAIAAKRAAKSAKHAHAKTSARTPPDDELAEYNKLVEEGRKVVASAKTAAPPDDEPIDHDEPQEPWDVYPAKAVPDPDGNESGDVSYNPLDPYDFGSYGDNLFQAVMQGWPTTNYRDTKLFIHDRAKAVAWFEQMLADYDAWH